MPLFVNFCQGEVLGFGTHNEHGRYFWPFKNAKVRRLRRGVILVLICFLTGCDTCFDKNRYQLINGAAFERDDTYINFIYLLDTKTGKVWIANQRDRSFSPMQRQE